LRPKRGTPDVIPGRWPVILWAAVCIPLAATLPALDSLEQTTRSWQWGPQLVTVRDTPYHNLALLKTENQFTLFTNGLWAFSAPDPLTVEPGVHLALLQHPAPRSVLLVGGGIAGQAGEVMKYPAIERIDYVELDPEIVRLAEIYLPDAVTSPVRSDRVHLYHDDAGVFLRRTDRTYDVILINSGDPMNLQLNRFFTLEFYRRLGRLLNAGGIVSFALAVPGNIIGPAQARYLRSIHSTLSAVFPQVMIYPGEDLRFFATNRHDILLNDPQQLAARLRARNLDLTYVREDTLADALNPTRLDYVASILSTDTHAAINRDFTPICYFNNLLLWAVQIHPTLGRILMNLAAVNPLHFWATWLAVVGVVVTFFWSGKPKPAGAVGVSVTVVGGVLMVEELILLLGFQLFAGYVYTQLALIIAAFMTGLALGAALYTGLTLRVGHARHWLLLVQFLLALYLGGTVHILFWLQHRLDRVPGTGTAWQLGLVFIGLALAGGILGGLHFSLAVKTWAGSEVPSGKIAGGLYGLDLVGAASGALLAALVLLPLYGLITTLGLFTLLNLASLAVLGRGKGIGVKGKGIKVEGIKGKGGEREKGGRTNLETNKEPDVERGRMILPPRH
jgi:spermidine synthase